MNVRITRAVLAALFAGFLSSPVVARQAAPAAPAMALTAAIPLDSAVTTGKLANGLTYFIRKNDRPAHRVMLRLAVEAGSLDEADDQQGLAHMLEHMAFNGSTHFKPGELVSYFESVGAKLGPHVNAYTSFTETVFMLDLPSDQPDVVQKGLTAFADFAGGLTLDPAEIDKERGVVTEEWRQGLGAGSRIRDQEIPVLYYHSRYADRLPIGKPDIIRTFTPATLRRFYDMYYRPERMAVIAVGDTDPGALASSIKATFGSLTDRTPAPPAPDAAVPLHQETLFSIVTDPEVTRSSVTLLREYPRQSEARVSDYRRDLVEHFFEQLLNDRLDELARRPDAKFLGAGIGDSALSKGVDAVSLSVTVQSGRIPEGLAAAGLEAKRAREFGFHPDEIDREKRSLTASYERAYAERDKTESGSFAQEYLDLFLEGDPSPGIAYEYQLAKQLIPGITDADIMAMGKSLLGEDNRVVLAVSPQKSDIPVPTPTELRATLASVGTATVTAWTETATRTALLDHKPEPVRVVSTRKIDAIGLTIVRFANGVEAWLKPTDFKNDQILFAMQAKGGLSTAPPADYPEASLADAYATLSGAAGLKDVDLQKLLAGKIARAAPFAGLSIDGFNGSSASNQLETALQLLYARFTQPGDDPDAFAFLKQQLTAAVANRLDNPEVVFADKVDQVNSSDHYTSIPLTVDRISRLDRSKMTAFYRDEFSNAANFTFFMVGSFTVDDAVPLLARYVGGLPSTGQATSDYKDVRISFPTTSQHVEVRKGTEPKARTVVSFSADPPGDDPMEQERVLAATDVLETDLRDILREELGQTYTVSVDLAQELPQKSGGFVEVSFGAAPENIDRMVDRVMQEVRKFRDAPPSADLLNRAKAAARRNYETQLKQNAYWLARFEAVQLFGQNPEIIAQRNERIDAVTAQTVQDAFRKYFPLDRDTIVTLLPQSK